MKYSISIISLMTGSEILRQLMDSPAFKARLHCHVFVKLRSWLQLFALCAHFFYHSDMHYWHILQAQLLVLGHLRSNCIRLANVPSKQDLASRMQQHEQHMLIASLRMHRAE